MVAWKEVSACSVENGGDCFFRLRFLILDVCWWVRDEWYATVMFYNVAALYESLPVCCHSTGFVNRMWVFCSIKCTAILVLEIVNYIVS